ncbi:type II toxin-antitoxin system RelB/DinJ family antitoxin [Streptococcus suis]|uniref:type II toxin-antitoxin system RelB/DinJ family antitoxin n=1 Tax=Streptococcus suis TaxID=1307 RepID=UPI000C190EF6|nr:type II toxin-antitoxin system RelB/DinJ family antitoxin [Streptococcus suis]
MSTIAIRVDDELKNQATELYKELGLDMTTAVKLFLVQSVKTRSIPFPVSLNVSDFDNDGKYITDERLLQAIRSLKEDATNRAVELDLKNPEHIALFDEEY